MDFFLIFITLIMHAINLVHHYFNLVIINTIVKQPTSVSYGSCCNTPLKHVANILLITDEIHQNLKYFKTT
jgi:hypothetical protein